MSTISGRGQGLIAALLALIAGYVDAYAILKYSVYASFMSGNTTQTGLRAGAQMWEASIHNFLPIPFFVLGVFVGTFLTEAPSTKRLPLSYLLLITAALLGLGIVIASFQLSDIAAIVALSVAMGVMNTTITRVGSQPVSLGYVTGSLNNLARCVALAARQAKVPNAQGAWDTYWWRASVLAMLWSSFLVGASLGAVTSLQLADWTLLLPTILLLLLAVLGV